MTDVLAQADRSARRARSARRPAHENAWLVRGLSLGVLALLLVGWHILGTSGAQWSLVISTPGTTAGELHDLLVDPTWWTDVSVTLREAAGGYLIGLAVAIVLIGVFVPYRAVGDFMAPFIAALNATPNVALAPLFIVWFGFGYSSKVVYVATSTFFIAFYGIYVGVRELDRTLLDNWRLLGASRFQLIREVYVPAVATWVVGSLRAGVAWALLAAVVAEFLGSRAGIGFRVAQATQTLQSTKVLAIILFVAILATVMDRLLVLAERRMSAWRLF